MSTEEPAIPEEEPHKRLERKSLIATIKGVELTRRILTFTIAGVVVTAAAIVIPLVTSDHSSGQSAQVTGNGNSVNQNSGSCDQTSNGSTCIGQLQQFIQQAAPSPESTDDQGFKAQLAQHDNHPPSGQGPWAFVVVDTGTEGLVARDSNEQIGDKVGYAPDRSLVWADCVTQTDYMPQGVTGDNNVGPKWVLVHWAHVAPRQVGTSEPNQTQHAWMYRGGLYPVGTNGNLPNC